MATLTERYAAAVARGIPENQRADVEREVAAAVADLVDARVERGESPGAAERAALLELGDPMRLAAEYSGRPLHLIGPALFPDYVRLLGVLLAVVPPMAGLATLVVKLLSGADAGTTAADTVLVVLNSAMQLVFWTTLLFAIVERVGGGARPTTWDPDLLPDVHRSRSVRLGDTLVSVALSLLVAGYIVWQQFVSPFTDTSGAPVPALEPGLWSFWLPFLLAVLVAGAVLEVVRYRAAGWNWGLVAVNAVLDAAFAVPVVALAAAGALLNPPFVAELAASGWTDAGSHLATTIILTTLAIVVWDILDTVLKARRDTAPATGARAANRPASSGS